MQIQIVAMTCKCCGEEMLIPWGVMQVGKLVEKVAIGIQIPWKECKNCGYELQTLRFRAPELGVKHQAHPGQSSHPGLKGLRKRQ